jgi:hypothetical protein
MIKKRTLFSALVTVAFTLIPPVSFADTDIGQGYKCSQRKILKNGKEVTLKKAKQSIQTKINNLGNSKSDKAKKAALNAIKKAFTTCTAIDYAGYDACVTETHLHKANRETAVTEYDACVAAAYHLPTAEEYNAATLICTDNLRAAEAANPDLPCSDLFPGATQ